MLLFLLFLVDWLFDCLLFLLLFMLRCLVVDVLVVFAVVHVTLLDCWCSCFFCCSCYRSFCFCCCSCCHSLVAGWRVCQATRDFVSKWSAKCKCPVIVRVS